MSSQQRRQRWRELITEQSSSDLSIAEFCRQHGVSQASFYQWRKRLETEPLGGNVFVPVSVVGCSMVEVEFPCGTVMRVPADGERHVLRDVISLLRDGR